ncbi:ATP-binding protein [Oribacterium sp. NK2B42]|uniref:ATP-binding protein n=1 Tax=Oribacterium sp. NK2B42 TaxID=689781 RepID=UPI000425CDBC|nr:ATP-binding protein [Oribacterium sp. NK2B42]
MLNAEMLSKFESIGYIIEVLMAELLFLHAYKKRNLFWVRFPAAAVIAGIIASGITYPAASIAIYRFMFFFFIIALTVGVMLFCYKGNLFSIVSSCIAGVATQHIAFKLMTIISLIPSMSALLEISVIYRIIVEILTLTVVYTIVYLMVARSQVPDRGSIRLNVLSVIVVLMCIGVNRLVADAKDLSNEVIVASSIYAILCCSFALSIQFYLHKWQQEKAESMVIKGLLSASEKQYEQWKEMVEFNNIQMHDLKHLLNHIEHLAGKEKTDIPDLSPIRESIEGFAPIVRTGNDVIDVLLRNMGALCRQQGVRLNCVSFTDKLDKFDSMSLYFLFGNAIDNARTGAASVSDKEKRLVDVSLKQFGDSVIIHIWNYFEGDITFEDKLPVSKDLENGHGFGIKSIKVIVDKFGGAFKTQVEGDVFHLNIILPLT